MSRRTPLAELEPQRICIVKPSALGDIVQVLPVLGMLRARFPEAHIAWVVKSTLAGLLEGHPQLDEVIPLPYPKGALARTAAIFRTMRKLRSEKFDLAIDMQGLFRSGLLMWSTRAKRRIGSNLSREFAHLAFTDRVDVGPWHQPALETHAGLARALGCDPVPPQAVVHVQPEATEWAKTRLAGLPRPLLAINPGAQWETKRWPERSYAALGRLALQNHPGGIVIVGGPDDRRLGVRLQESICRADADETGQARRRVVNLVGKSNLQQLAALCREADVFLSGDSGPLHLASALKTPVVGVFTCTDPVRSGPRQDVPGAVSRCVSTKVDCAASYITRCPKLICMDELTPARVWPELNLLLQAAIETTTRKAG